MSDLRPYDRGPVVIENVYPELDGGRFPVKRVAGDTLDVWADIFAEGHGLLAARLKYRECRTPEWRYAPMRVVDNDRWTATISLENNARYEYTIEAWPDAFASWQADLRKRLDAGEDVTTELLEGRRLLQQAGVAAPNAPEAFLDPDLKPPTPDQARLSAYRSLGVTVDREAAEFAAWYEMFPRSQGTVPGRHATFGEAARRLEDIAAMGFDVVYLPPIHPIGRSHRKGPNNTLDAGRDDPGSPWAIGSDEGGHKSVHPDLGSLADFDAFVREAQRLGLEIALDYALQCSPDHPYAREHPDWFYRRPDGTIRYAENPPKKYQDIYPINFYCDDREALWNELKSIILFWREHGVRTFRVDNPHTKPFPFWEWLISEVQRDHPEVIFLAEAFTRPKVMKYLAKAGFSQSYTYFTWRNDAADLRDYLDELTHSEAAEYLRGNLFVNTPDILHEYLQAGGRPAFEIRLVLAATLSSVYGLYSGFELLEATALHHG
ncbi:MAG: alpha-1,4-glucan--maltose-1-phosphate maltosyltransferase, partial [Chloroflexi bacterium]|nr:alpha-1,4-glucan--maltose-1-phosphate maltosyltransferase [Chloroflexota bacterium]